MRLHAQTATIENGFVHLPERPPGSTIICEFVLFPERPHDDQVDSTAQALAWAKQRPPGHACSSAIGGWRRRPRDGLETTSGGLVGGDSALFYPQGDRETNVVQVKCTSDPRSCHRNPHIYQLVVVSSFCM